MNKNISKIHPDVLDKGRKDLLQKLVSTAQNFILGGGTALALQLAHRKSFDFDFFSQNPISKNLLEKVSSKIEIGNVSVDSSDELTFFTKDGIKVTFLYYPYRHIFEPLKLESRLKLFDCRDIAIMKAYTIGRRGEYRDYFDLFTTLKRDFINIGDLITKAKDVYGSIFSEKIFLEQLVYFEDLLNFDIVPVNSKSLPSLVVIKSFFEKLVRNYT